MRYRGNNICPDERTNERGGWIALETYKWLRRRCRVGFVDYSPEDITPEDYSSGDFNNADKT